MFVIVVEGGPNDGKCIDRDGEVSSGTLPPMEIEDLADAQDWIERNLRRFSSETRLVFVNYHTRRNGMDEH
jgi:hypothetical protein